MNLRRLERGGPALHAILLLLLVPADPASAQGTADDPLMGSPVLGNAAELVLVWSGFQESDVHQDVLDFLSIPESPDPDDSGDLTLESQQLSSGATGTGGERASDVAVGDLNGDGIEDLVAIWDGPGASLNAVVPVVRPDTLDWIDAGPRELAPAGSLHVGGESPTGVRVVTGFLDGDPEPELVVAYWAADGSVVITVYDGAGTLVPLAGASVADEMLLGFGSSSSNANRSRRFDVATGDLDGDGTDEVLLAWGTGFETGCPAPSGRCWEVLTKAYDYDAAVGALLPTTAVQVFENDGFNNGRYLGRIAVEAGDYDGDAIDEVAVAFHQPFIGSTHDWRLQLLEWDPADLDAVTFGEGDVVGTSTGNNGYPLSLVAADMDMDGRDELVWAGRTFRGFRIDDPLLFTQVKGATYIPMPGNASRRAVAVADLDADQDIDAGFGDWRKEIVLTEVQDVNDGCCDLDSRIFLRVLGWGDPESFNMEQRDTFATGVLESTGSRPLLVAAGDFGRTGVRVGWPPFRSRRSEIAQPLVVLNAPPTHFDVFGAQSFDVSKCYNANIGSCEFVAEYEKQTSVTMEVETEVRTDWGVSVTAEGGFEVPIIGVGVKTSMTATHGEGFSKYAANGQTFQTTETRTAIRDDRILATVSDYDVWEYPVLKGGETVGYIAVVRPVEPRLQWFPSKSWTASTYIPVHEVGNILSYPNFGEQMPDQTLNPALDEAILIAGTATTLDETCCGTFDVDFSSFTTASTTKEIFNGISGSVDFDIPLAFIPDIGVEGEYSVEEISTHTSTVGMDLGLGIVLGSIDTAIGGGTSYTVRPYSYWGTYGALVVDYAVQPELSGGPPFETWWQERYGHLPDPAFLLPFRLDVEKGLAGNDQLAAETRDILFDPGTAGPGDDVVMTARIQNYSLLATPGPVKVRFFIGDPGGAGTAPACGAVPVEPCAIVGTQGETDVLTTDSDGMTTSIPAQGSALARLEWTVPTGAVLTGDDPLRIYGVIDPDAQLAEIHEENNKGAVSFIRVPEPGPGAAGAAALLALAGLARRRQRLA